MIIYSREVSLSYYLFHKRCFIKRLSKRPEITVNKPIPICLKADFHSVEFFVDWTGNPLFTCENVALDLKRMLRVSNNLLCQIQSAQKILQSVESA